MTPMIAFTLYSRSYCHLCDDMLAALQTLHDSAPFEVTVVDVDADPALVELYDERVPVLTARRADGDEQELCHYFLDIPLVQRYLLSQLLSLPLSQPLN
jgi:hypothetical protein